MRPFSSTRRKNNVLDYEIKDSYSKMNRQNSNFENRKNDYLEELFIGNNQLLQNIWDELGVTTEYRNTFIENILKINELEREDIIEKEKKTFIKLKEYLLNLKREIISRENNINSLKKFNKIIEDIILEGNTININSSKFQEIINNIIGLRYNAINIVNQICYINKIYFVNEKKWNLNKLKEKYFYDPDYLNKMKEDLKFLQNSVLTKFIETNNTEIDPFLTNFTDSGLNNKKVKIPLSEEIMKAINDSRYLLLKESVFINNKKKFRKNNGSEVFSNTEYNIFNKNNNNLINSKTNHLKISISPIVKKMKSQNKSKSNINISREIHFHKKELGIKNYNELFYLNNPLYKSINIKKQKIKLKENSKNKFSFLKNNTNSKIFIERDEIDSNALLNTYFMEEKNKNKKLNKEIFKLQKESNEYQIKYSELKKLYDKLNNKLAEETKKREKAEKDVDILQIKLKELSNKNEELIEKLKKTQNYGDKNDNIGNNESKIKDEKEEIKNQLDKKDEEILRLKKEIENIKSEKPSSNSLVRFYKGNISNLVNSISEKAYLEKIPDYLKRALLLDDSIYKDDFYFKGIFPKIVISNKGEGDDNINGICSLSYENNENLSENLNLKINCIYGLEDFDSNAILMINFIKENMEYDKLVVYLLYDNQDNKFIANKEAKKIFENLGFKWLCVVRNEEKNQRYIKLYFSKNVPEKRQNQNNSKKNIFNLENYILITLNNEENTNLLKNNKIELENNIKANNNKFINQNSIYILLFDNKELKIVFTDNIKENEIKESKQKLWKFNLNKNNWNILKEEEKNDIKNINFENSLFKEIEEYYTNNNIKFISDLQKKNISANFENTYSILIDDIYYNRISSDKIKILKEKKTNSLFFLIPSIDNTVLFYISEINDKLKEVLIDSHKNIYEEFLEFQPSTQKELFNFSLSSIRDISYIPQKLKEEQKIIYIPAFMIKTHLYSYDFKEIDKNIKINNIENNETLYLNSVDEYINIEFNPDDNIKNSFSVIPVEDKIKNVRIKDSFIIGIFANDIVYNNKLPLMQFLYVTKENFITKDNYKK